MNDLISRVLELQRMAHDLMYLGIDNTPLYANDFARANKSVLTLSEALSTRKSHGVEEEANLCLALLMGYNATIYDSGNKEKKKQKVLDRAFDVLELLPASLLKVRLLAYCYGEVYDEDMLEEAHTIIDSWNQEELTVEQQEIVDELRNMEENQYPFEILED